jgi:hypothetical protein
MVAVENIDNLKYYREDNSRCSILKAGVAAQHHSGKR